MNFLKKLLGNDKNTNSVEAFWTWFENNQRGFFITLEQRDSQSIENRFMQKIMPKLQALNGHFYCEAGMYNDTTAELVITAEGDIKSFVWVEELVAAAPLLENWKFTALKPAFRGGTIDMNGYTFGEHNISFFYEEEQEYPDEISLILVHQDFSEDDRKMITHGTILFLDCLLGELNSVTQIDNVKVKGAGPAGQQPVPMDKLSDFLTWKEKEFVEKYQGTRYQTENDAYSSLEGSDKDGLPVIAILNKDLLRWDAKPSHPWMAVIQMDYEKKKGGGKNGMPGSEYLKLMREMEDELTQQLPDAEGYLDLGRETYHGKRTIYLACKEFRTASKKIAEWIDRHQQEMTCTYDIYKDKYWRTMNKFQAAAAD